jgi:hypothetical protein
MHTCWPLPDGLADAVEDGANFFYTYKVQIGRRGPRSSPQAFIDATDLIRNLDDRHRPSI